MLDRESSFIILETITPLENKGKHEFKATFRLGQQPVEVPITPAELLNYHRFQRGVLAKSGLLFRDPACERMTRKAANEAWCRFCQRLLSTWRHNQQAVA